MKRDELAARRKTKQSRTAAAKALRETLEGGYGREKRGRESVLPIKTATEWHEQSNSWMHRFSDVRKDERGFYILREDNPDGWRMQPDDLIQDVALNTTPYWKVLANDQERIDLEPIGPNPLLTGVGAGGYVFHASDFKVLTGEYERERVGKIIERLESGDPLQIFDVKYLLLGTVPLNFGPNGPQGGWYNPSDLYSNRAERGMKSEDIVRADALTLSRMGFDIPSAALDGEIKPDLWGQFIESPAQMFSDWLEVEPVDLDTFFARYVKAPWIVEGRRDPDEIVDGMKSFFKRVDRSRWGLFQVSGEDDWSLAEALQHPQEEVQMRAVSRALMQLMSFPGASATWVKGSGAWEGTVVLDDLHRFVAEAQGSLTVYDRLLEVLGNYFSAEEAVPILLAGTELESGYLRARVYSGLARQRYKKLTRFVFKEKDGEALKSLASGLLDHGYLPGRDVVEHLMVTFAQILRDGSVYTRYYASDGIKNLLRLANKQGLDVTEVLEALDEYEASVRHNPDSGWADDAAWLAVIEETMTGDTEN